MFKILMLGPLITHLAEGTHNLRLIFSPSLVF